MRRSISISLFLCLTGPFVLLFSHLQWERHQVRRQIKREIIAGIDSSQLVQLSFCREQSKALLRWEHAREFEYESQMYDVVFTYCSGDSITYWCWWDHEETALNRKLMALVDGAWGHHPLRQQKQNRLLDFLRGLYTHDLSTLNNFADAARQHHEFYCPAQRCTSVLFAPLVPPPEFS